MNITYKIKGIGCGGCISSIEKELNNHPQIEAKLAFPERTVTIKDNSITKVELNAILAKAGNYALED